MSKNINIVFLIGLLFLSSVFAVAVAPQDQIKMKQVNIIQPQAEPTTPLGTPVPEPTKPEPAPMPILRPKP